jgi:hypothetical protein
MGRGRYSLMRESWYYDGWRLEYWLLDYVQSEC